MTDREKAKREYLGGKSLKDIAIELNISGNTIRSWKRRDGWPKVHRTAATKKKTLRQKEETQPVIENGLTEKQQLFCELYVKNYNGTQSYMSAYGADYKTACSNSSRLLAKANIRAYIKSLKEIKQQAILADATDVVEMYMKIAFANIGDFVAFGRREVQVMTAFGPLYEKDEHDEKAKHPVMKTVNYVDIKESAEVDAGVIDEVSQGKDGIKVKLADRMKALEWLGKYFMMNPMDRHHCEYDAKKQELDRMEYERKKKADEDW